MHKLKINNNNNVRFYFALTNFCNRSCELCSCHSDPTRKTNLSFEKFKEILNIKKAYEAQLEGGEPTVHPDFDKMVEFLVNDPYCKKIIVCTNAVLIPIDTSSENFGKEEDKKSIEKIKIWLNQFKLKPFVLKPSINSHLIKHSSIHMLKMSLIKEAWEQLTWKDESELVFNVRRIPKPMTSDGEQWIIDLLKEKKLYEYCNDFEYQRYGKAQDEEDLKIPYIVSNPMEFYLIAPDGKDFGKDLIARANYMEKMN